jgi:hypothetical protein
MDLSGPKYFITFLDDFSRYMHLYLLHSKDPQEDNEITLRRSTRVRNPTIPSEFIVYLQESDCSIGTVNDPETFSQAMSRKESNLWHNARTTWTIVETETQ